MSAENIQQYLANKLYEHVKIDEKYVKFWNDHHCTLCGTEMYDTSRVCCICKENFCNAHVQASDVNQGKYIYKCESCISNCK